MVDVVVTVKLIVIRTVGFYALSSTHNVENVEAVFRMDLLYYRLIC